MTENKQTLEIGEKLREKLEEMIETSNEINGIISELPKGRHGQIHRSLKPKSGEYLQYFDGISESLMGEYRSENGDLYKIQIQKYKEKENGSK
jgi:hypothetical protein